MLVKPVTLFFQPVHSWV